MESPSSNRNYLILGKLIRYLTEIKRTNTTNPPLINALPSDESSV